MERKGRQQLPAAQPELNDNNNRKKSGLIIQNVAEVTMRYKTF